MFMLSAVHAHPLSLPHPKDVHPVGALLSMLRAVSEHDHFHYPPEINSLLEDSAMAREIYRL